MGKFDEEWQARFERFGRGYQADHLVSGWSESGLERRLALFAQLLTEHNLQGSARILDVGCGAGTYVRFLGRNGFRAVGLDYSFPSLQRAVTADTKKNGTYLEGDAYCLPFADETFDMVVSIGTFQAMQDPQRALIELVRVLRQNGTVVVEGLNSRAIVSRIESILNRFKGIPPRIRTYSPQQVEEWLTTSGVTLLNRKGVYLAPRQLSIFNKIFDFNMTNMVFDYFEWISRVTAHSYLFIGQKVYMGVLNRSGSYEGS